MALGGNYTTIDRILNKIRRDSNITIDEEDAVEWVAEIMEIIAPHQLLDTVITDGNPDFNHPQPIEVTNYRAKIPCNSIVLKDVFELGYFKKLMPSYSVSHRVNFSTNPTASEHDKRITPEFWYKNSNIPNTTPFRLGTYQHKSGYIFTDFPEGHLILIYLGWPMDENENLLIPADAKVIRAMTSYLQYRIDYKLWRSGDITERVYNDSEANYLFDVGAMDTFIKMPSQDQLEAISNFMTKTVRNDAHFQTHFTSLGRPDKFRTHG